MKDACAQLLDVLDFPQPERRAQLENLAGFCEEIGLSPRDLQRAATDWIPRHWDISLAGVRRCLAFYLREFIEVGRTRRYRAEGIPLIYGISPSLSVCFEAVKQAGGDRVYVGFPDFILVIVVGGFFGRPELIMQDAGLLGHGCRHCGLNRTRLNSALNQLIPAPDLIWSWGYYCNEAMKTEEMIDSLSEESWPSLITALPHDTRYGEREDENNSRVGYLAEQFREAHRQIARITGFEITKKNLFQALRLVSDFTLKLDAISKTITNSEPQPVGANELALFGTAITLSFNTDLNEMLAALDDFEQDVAHRLAAGRGVLPAHSPKLGCHFIPLCIPWIDRAFRSNGVNLTFGSNVSFTRSQFLPYRSLDPYRIAAEIWLRSPNSVNSGYQIEIMVEMLREHHVDGMLYGFFSFDRWLGANAGYTLSSIEQRTGVQHYFMEGDLWEDTAYKPGDRMTQIENICYSLKMKKMLSSAAYAETFGDA